MAILPKVLTRESPAENSIPLFLKLLDELSYDENACANICFITLRCLPESSRTVGQENLLQISTITDYLTKNIQNPLCDLDQLHSKLACPEYSGELYNIIYNIFKPKFWLPASDQNEYSLAISLLLILNSLVEIKTKFQIKYPSKNVETCITKIDYCIEIITKSILPYVLNLDLSNYVDLVQLYLDLELTANFFSTSNKILLLASEGFKCLLPQLNILAQLFNMDNYPQIATTLIFKYKSLFKEARIKISPEVIKYMRESEDNSYIYLGGIINWFFINRCHFEAEILTWLQRKFFYLSTKIPTNFIEQFLTAAGKEKWSFILDTSHLHKIFSAFHAQIIETTKSDPTDDSGLFSMLCLQSTPPTPPHNIVREICNYYDLHNFICKLREEAIQSFLTILTGQFISTEVIHVLKTMSNDSIAEFISLSYIGLKQTPLVVAQTITQPRQRSASIAEISAPSFISPAKIDNTTDGNDATQSPKIRQRACSLSSVHRHRPAQLEPISQQPKPLQTSPTLIGSCKMPQRKLLPTLYQGDSSPKSVIESSPQPTKIVTHSKQEPLPPLKQQNFFQANTLSDNQPKRSASVGNPPRTLLPKLNTNASVVGEHMQSEQSSVAFIETSTSESVLRLRRHGSDTDCNYPGYRP